MDNTLDHTFESANRVYDKNQLCPTIPTCGGGGIQPKVIEETRCVGGLSNMKWGTQYHQQDRVYKGEIALAQPANLPEGSYKYAIEEKGKYRIRKLTPRECWRLMGYTDADFDKANEVNSATQLYKQAGNAIVKQVLMAIFKQML
jgi:DNA (cytosine-5)-methyltransferase 1